MTVYKRWQIVELCYFSDVDFGDCSTIFEFLSKVIVASMKVIDWKQIGDGDFVVELLLGKLKDNVLSDSGAGTHNKKTHI